MLNKILRILHDVLKYPAFYGLVNESEIEELKRWDYFVVKRVNLRQSNTSYSYDYAISFICEDYIKEGFELEIIAALEKGTRLKKKEEPCQYGYARKGKTGEVVEVITILFTTRVPKCQ